MNDIKEKIADYISQHKSSLLYDIDHHSIEQSVMGLIKGSIRNIDDKDIQEHIYKEIGQQEIKQALQTKEEGVVVYSQNSFVVSPRLPIYHDDGTTQPPQQQERLQINSCDMRILSKYNLIFRECEFNTKLLAHYDFKCHSATFKNCIFLKNELILLMQSFVMMSILITPIFMILLIFTNVNLKKPLVSMGQPLKKPLIFHKLFSKET